MKGDHELGIPYGKECAMWLSTRIRQVCDSLQLFQDDCYLLT
jgi:hypothetical protein